MKVYNKETGKSTDHHPVDAREICRERPDEFTMIDPKAPKVTPEEADDTATKRAAEEAERERLATEAKARNKAVADAKKAANKLRDVADTARAKANGARGDRKEAAVKAAEEAEKAADDADSAVAILEAGGPLPESKVAMQ